jgi:glucose-1-phosphate cytidylyltransferase|tara:strand:+ start:585 stop:1286 length:702 start_codon:yes stop_codon:yes gene_type:complete
MKTVILAGGLGTRISEETNSKPKPMIRIGEKPILWHIMKIFSTYGINDFVVCCGYKNEIIKEYFENIPEKWNVELVDTGLNSMTGGRIRRIKKYVNDEKFFLTYGDDLKSVNISELENFHVKNKQFVTLTAVQPPGRFGILQLENNNVIEMREKPPGDGNWINGGYYVLEPEIFDYLTKDSDVWENEPLNELIKNKKVSAFKYNGIYQPLDTLNDKINLEKMWSNGKAYWKVW